MPTNGLMPIDEELVAFLAERRDVSEAVIRANYVRVKAHFNFASKVYKQFTLQVCDLLSPVYGDETEESLCVTHQFHAAMLLYRHISYSYYKQARYLEGARYILEVLGVDSRRPAVVDYGCGLGYVSMAMAQIRPETKVYLVDMDSMVLDFAEYRFNRRGINFETIRVTRENTYPQLPRHNVCIATQVMEHLLRPMVAYQHIYEAMEQGGILIGSFGDHRRMFWHVSPDLQALRTAVARDFRPMGKYYVKA